MYITSLSTYSATVMYVCYIRVFCHYRCSVFVAIALCYFALVSPFDYDAVWSDEGSPAIIKWFIVLDYVSSCVPFIVSVLYHVFMPHNSGRGTYNALLKLDVCGVWFSCTFGAISLVYCSLHCRPWLRNGYLLIYAIISCVCLLCMIFSRSARGRVIPLAIQYCFRTATHFVRMTPIGSGHPSAIPYYLTMDAIAGPGALINALHIPERWIPGKVDYLCNGHNLMHIVAFLSIAICRRGFLLDMLWLTTNQHC